MNTLEIKELYKSFGDVTVLKGINLDVAEGEFISLLGPSGCGKTTLLRIIAGLSDLTSGAVYVNGKNMEGIPPHARTNGMVFQNYALFPHMTVEQNIAYGLKMRKEKKEDIAKAVKWGLELIHLEGLERRYPKELSGGQQQRVALVRALVLHPTLLLLDEPLCNLDAQLRKEMRIEIRNIQKKLNVTTIFVTHDQEEALTMSDRIAVMNKGVIEQLGTPTELYENPKTQFVANFIGSTNIISGRITEELGENLFHVDIQGSLVKAECSFDAKVGDEVTFSLRPERIVLTEKPDDGKNSIACQVVNRIYLGASIRFVVALNDGRTFSVDVPSLDKASSLLVGDGAYMNWEPAHMFSVL